MTSQLNKIADYWNQRSFGYSLDNQEELLHDQEKWIELAFQDETFDLVITRNVTWNLEKPVQAYKEILRVLKNKGHLLNVDGNHYYHYQDQDYNRAGHSDHQHMEGIDVSIIDNIAKELKLSYVLRPQYDIEILKEIGFQQIESEILSKEKTKEGKELIRQFLIHAIK